MLAQLFDDFAIIFRYFFGIDFDDFQSPQMSPWENILGAGASKNHWLLPTGPWVAQDWWRRGRDMALKMVQAPFSSIWVPFFVDVGTILGR